MALRCVLLGFLSCWASLVLADDDVELRACAARALPERTMRQVQDVKVISASGWTRESRRTVYWRRFDDGTIKVLFRVDRPKTEAGLKLLVIQKPAVDPVIYVYSPDLNRARRVLGSGASNSVLGTDFTFEDAMHLQRFLSAAGTRRGSDTLLDGYPAYVAETRPDEDNSAYTLIRTYIDKDSCLPMKSDFYGPNGELDKTLTLSRDTLSKVGERWIPLRMVMESHRQRQRTELTASQVEINVELPAGLFTVTEIEKSH